MAGVTSRDVSVLTPREISKPDADAHGRPAGLTALVPVHIGRNLGTDDVGNPKSENSFSTNPTGAAHFRPRVFKTPTHATGAPPITLDDWAEQFQPTRFAGSPGVAPLITDARTGELKTADYTNLATITGDPGVIKRAEVVQDLNPFAGNPTYSNIKALDVALSRTGRFTYSLWCVDDSVGPQYRVIFVAFDNTTGLEVDRHDVQVVPGPVDSVRGGICVIDDSTGESVPDLTFADCLVAVQSFDGGLVYTDIQFFDYLGGTTWAMTPFVLGIVFAAAPGFDPWAGVQVNNAGPGFVYVHWAFREDPVGLTARLQENIYTAAGGFLVTQFPFGGLTDIDWGVTPVMVQRKRDPGTADNRVFYAAIPFGFPSTIALSSTKFGGVFVTGPGTIVVPETVTALDADAISPVTPILGYTWPVLLTYVGQGVGPSNNVISFLISTDPGGPFSTPIIIASGNDVTLIRQLGCRQLRVLNRDPSIAYLGPQAVARVGVVSVEPDTTGGLNGDKFYVEFEIFDDGVTFTVDPRTTTPTLTNTDLNALNQSVRDFAYDVSRWSAFTLDPCDMQALLYEINTLAEGRVRVVAPFSGVMVELNAREYERCLPFSRRDGAIRIDMYAKGQGQDASGFKEGVSVRTLKHPGGPDPTNYLASTQADGITAFDTPGFVLVSNTGATPLALDETEPAILWPSNGLGNSLLTADVDEVGSAGPGPRHLRNINWGIDKVVGATGLILTDYGRVLVGHTIRIVDPPTIAGRYSIEAFDVDANGVITDIELSPPPPAGTAGTATSIRALITAAPSDSVRLIVTPRTDLDRIAHSNAVHPAVVDIDYIKFSREAGAFSTNALINVPLQNSQLPSIISASFKVFQPSPGVFPPTPPVQPVVVEITAGATLLATKAITDSVTTLQKSPGGTATVFGTQSFNDDTVYGPGPGAYPPAPGGPQPGDFFTVFAGPNKGTYIIQELFTDPSSPHRIIVDRPFPSPGAGGNPAWAITSARKTDMGGGFILFSMSFDVAGLVPVGSTSFNVRTIFYDPADEPVDYEIDSIAVQWS